MYKHALRHLLFNIENRIEHGGKLNIMRKRNTAKELICYDEKEKLLSKFNFKEIQKFMEYNVIVVFSV